MTLQGQCLCGAVRVSLTPPLGPITHCHCRSCRLSHGAAFVTWTSVPPDRFAWLAGENLVSWRRSSPAVRWGACQVCSSPMLYIADAPGHGDGPSVSHVYVTLANLTSEIAERPTAHVSYEEHLAWIEGAETLPKHVGKTETRFEGG